MIRKARDATGVLFNLRDVDYFHSGFLVPVFISVVVVSLFSDFLPVFFGNYAGQRFFQAFLLVFVAASILLVPDNDIRTDPYRFNWPAYLVALGFVGFTFPASASEYRWVEGGMFGFFFLAFSLLGWRISAKQRTEKVAVLLAVVILTGSFFYAAMSLTMYVFAITDDFSKLIDVIPWGFVNMRYWSHLATWFIPLFPLALLCGPLRGYKLWRAAVFLTAGIWWWVVLLTSARGSMVSLVLAACVVLVIFGRAVLPWLALSSRFALLGIALWCLLSWAIPELVFEETVIRRLHGSASTRMPLWIEAWQMSLQNFPWGMGAQSWLTHSVLSSEYMVGKTLGHPHNMYLMWAAEYGWALVALIGILMGVTLRRLVLLRKLIGSGSKEHATLLIAFTASCVAGLAHAGVSAVFLVPASMSVAFLILGVFWAFTCDAAVLSRPSGALAKNAVTSQSRRRLTAAFFVLILGVLWFKEIWLYHQAMEADLVAYSERSSAPLLPRFWLHGYFPRPESR